MCLVCLFPVGLEATYWIAAATRVVYSLLFIGCATLSLDYCYKSDKVKFLVMFAVFGMLSVFLELGNSSLYHTYAFHCLEQL